MPHEKPLEGVTYVPESDILPVSEGLPRTVTQVATRPNLDVFVVHYETTEGEGFQSGNLWTQWLARTGAKPVGLTGVEKDAHDR